ncbi:MAG TPA: response regulator [Candidatus Hydrogenedentes bacterium]|nr:response regulator [Candidatus Hydrogenedentota bacterium]
MSHIMLVDDDVDLAQLIRTKLAAEGHEVSVIHSGDGAFEMAKQVKPDLVVLDIMLPGETGYRICRRLRKDPELYQVGILILTALGEEPEVLHGLEQGADDYLSKPFKLDHLMDKIVSLEALLDSAKQRHSATGLPGTEAVKREINHRLARGMAIACCYIDMVGFKPYCAVTGVTGQTRALAFMANMLNMLTRQMGVYESYTAHLGGEHFVVMLNLEDYERFCNTLMEMFDQKMKELYTPEQVQQGFIMATDRRGKTGRYPLMMLSIGIAHNQFRQYKSAKKVFEVLAQTRQMARPVNKSAMFADRRQTDR